jgi:squalene-hopene/tetraprenyl-beta-curcumene cyclase
MKALILRASVLAVCAVSVIFSADTTSSTAVNSSWSPQAAASYLDGRLTWWADWDQSARDHGTFCVSCHTVATYAVSRLTLRAALSEQGPSPIERRILDNVTKRVRMWDEVEPYYPDATRGVPKTAESRGTEAILNAWVLVNYDAAKGTLSPDTRLALDHVWALQLKSGDAQGAWSWLQFHNQPWEGDSQFYGSALAAIAVGSTPASYRDTPEVKAGLQALKEYLVKNRDSQTLMDRVILLWASAKLPKLLSKQDVKAKETIDEVFAKQQADGGFSMTDFAAGWKRRDKTPLETKSDGYATGVVAYVLQETGMPAGDPKLQRALAWLAKNQEKSDGRWLAYSMNKQRDLSSDIGKFMSDAATAYAVLALDRAQR